MVSLPSSAYEIAKMNSDHLFANWSQMQANKASEGTKRDLQQWLEKHAAEAGVTMPKGAKEDLQWLESSKDLSSVGLAPRQSEKRSEKSTEHSTDKSGGGFAAFFGCASRRK